MINQYLLDFFSQRETLTPWNTTVCICQKHSTGKKCQIFDFSSLPRRRAITKFLKILKINENSLHLGAHQISTAPEWLIFDNLSRNFLLSPECHTKISRFRSFKHKLAVALIPVYQAWVSWNHGYNIHGASIKNNHFILKSKIQAATKNLFLDQILFLAMNLTSTIKKYRTIQITICFRSAVYCSGQNCKAEIYFQLQFTPSLTVSDWRPVRNN